MQALQLKQYGGPDHVAFAELPRPTPGPGELLVRVHAVGLNPIDNLIPNGDFKPILKLRLPATLGSDLAGVVVEVGTGVTRFHVGDAVYASIFDTPYGSLAEFAVVPEQAAALKPANLDFVQAASIPMVGLTAWQAMHERMQLQPGQKVFIPAGSGGIGTFAIQLARHLGARVGTTTSTANVALVRSLGADEVIDYKQQPFEQVLRDYDAVLGTLRGDGLEKGHAHHQAWQSYRLADRPTRRRFRPRARHERGAEAGVWLAQPQDHRPGAPARRPLCLPLRASRRQPAGADRRFGRSGKHPPRHRPGVSFSCGETSAGLPGARPRARQGGGTDARSLSRLCNCDYV
jgi:hypothetical protein